MQIIKNSEVFEAFYFYGKEYLTPNKYPIKYPCVVEHITREGGMGGEYIEHRITYCPEWCDWKSWVKGFEMGKMQYTEL